MKKISKIGAAVAVGLTLSGCIDRVEQNQTTLRFNADGSLMRTFVGPEMICLAPFCAWGARSVTFDTTEINFTFTKGSGAAVQGEQGRADASRNVSAFLRTKDNKILDEVSITVTIQVNGRSPYLNQLNLRAGARSSDAAANAQAINSYVAIALSNPLVQAIREEDALDIQSKGPAIGTRVTRDLQTEINTRLGVPAGGVSPITVVRTTIGGVGFDAATEEVLAQQGLAAGRADMARAQQESSGTQIQGAEAQAGIYAAIRQRTGSDTGACLSMVQQRLLPPGTNCFPGIISRPAG